MKYLCKRRMTIERKGYRPLEYNRIENNDGPVVTCSIRLRFGMTNDRDHGVK